MDIEPAGMEEVEAFEAEYQEYLRTRTPEQKAEDEASLERVLVRIRADRQRIFEANQERIYKRLLAEIFK